LEYADSVLEILHTKERYQESKNHHGKKSLEIGNSFFVRKRDQLEIPDKGGLVDPIADMLITIKNGYMAKKPSVTIPVSKFKLEIAKVLEKEKFIGNIKSEDREITIELLYDNHKPKISQIQKVSKLGLRVYSKSKKIPTLKGGRGTYILSTPQGVMTGKEAKAKKLGGEVICRVW